MFFWPHLELTEYEKNFVGIYKTDPSADGKTPGKPGVLRRTYKVLLNNVANPAISGQESVHNSGVVQIARRARIFGLTFATDVTQWRLNIMTASGESFTPTLPGQARPLVSTLAPGFGTLPLIIEPNWELLPNQQLIFEGVCIVETAKILDIAVHVWEFPKMVAGAPPTSPQTSGARC
jgi:hypothetical protein